MFSGADGASCARALLWGVLATTVLGLLAGIVRYQVVVSAPPPIAPAFFKLDLASALTPAMRLYPVIAPALVLVGTMMLEDRGTCRGMSRPRLFRRS